MGTNLALLIGRILMSVIFLGAGFSKIADFAGTTGYMATRPAFASLESALPILAGFAIVAEVGGGLSLVLGWLTRLGALGLVLFLLPTTFVFHNFWTYPPAAQGLQQAMFLKNLSMLGGSLLVVYWGAGPASLDAKTRH